MTAAKSASPFAATASGADIQPGQLLRITGKVQQSGTREASMLDPAYQVIDVPEEQS